jgi:hypothetical protein
MSALCHYSTCDVTACALQVPVSTGDDGLDVDALEVMLQQQQSPRCG